MKEEKYKKVNNVFKFLFFFFLIAFITVYLSHATGYYDYELHKKVTLTEEKIKQFEQDVADGKNIDLKEYIEHTDKNYKTKTSRLGSRISENIEAGVKKGIIGVFDFLNKMVND